MRRLFSPGLQKNARKDNPINFSSFGVGARSAAIRNRISRNVFTANRGVNFTAGPPTVGIEPITSEEVLVLVLQGDTETFELTLNKPPLNATRIELKSSDPTALSVDKPVVEFNRSNWATPVTITATALTNSPSATIELSPLYSSFKKLINVRGASVAISSTNVILSEGESSDITIDLDDPVTNVTMNIQNNDPTNFQLDKTTLSFTSNSLSQTFNVTALRDYKVLSDITSSLIVSVAAGSDNGYLSMAPKTIDLTHVNIDTASMSVSPTTVALDEGNSSSIQVSLGTKPTTDVVLDVVLSDTTNFSIDYESLTFLANSGPNQNQTITVTAIRDYKEMANINATLTVSVSDTSSATEYIGLSSQTVSLAHKNIDTAGVTTNLGSLSFELNEGENTSFDVSLATIPVTDVSLVITAANDKLTASPTTVYFDSTNWNVASPITLTANSDLVVSDEVIEVSMNVISTSSTEYQGKNVVLQVTYKNLDTHPVTCVSPTSVVDVIGGNYMFNGETTHDPNKKYGLYEGPYTFESVPQGHPIAFLNQSVPGVSYSVVDDPANPIIINIEGGDVAPNANGDYYTFTDVSGNTLDIANGSFKFMRGRTYKFRGTGSGIDSNNPLKIIHTDGTNESDVIQGLAETIVTIPTTQATSTNALRYENMNENGSVTANMSLTYKQAQDGNSYDYFYGNVSVQVQPNFSGYLSVECYNHGYMGGQDLFVYDDACAP